MIDSVDIIIMIILYDTQGSVRYLDSSQVIGVIITSLPDIDLQLYN